MKRDPGWAPGHLFQLPFLLINNSIRGLYEHGMGDQGANKRNRQWRDWQPRNTGSGGGELSQILQSQKKLKDIRELFQGMIGGKKDDGVVAMDDVTYNI